MDGASNGSPILPNLNLTLSMITNVRPKVRSNGSYSLREYSGRRVNLHDSLTGTLRQLSPRDPGHVAIYVCGPTVYGRIHVGNARPYVVFALPLKRARV